MSHPDAPSSDSSNSRLILKRVGRSQALRAGLGLLLGCAAWTGGLLRAEPAKESVIELPPLSVEDSQYLRPWRVAFAPGVEVLSRCDDDTTLQVMEQNRRLHLLLGQILPGSLQTQLATPITYVLYSGDAKPMLSREIVADMERPKESGSRSARREVSVMPNFRFWDRESLAIFFVVPTVNGTPQSLSASYVRELIEKHTPPLPRWFVEGFTTLYTTTVLKTKPVSGDGPTVSAFGSVQLDSGGDRVVIDPFVWISEKQTDLVKESRVIKREFIPLEALFSSLPPRRGAQSRLNPEAQAGGQYARTLADGTVQLTPFSVEEAADPNLPSRAQIWQAESALFIRWALDGKDAARRAALWQWVEKASRGPVTEETFTSCFGLDYAQAEQALRAYLPDAVRHTLTLSLPRTEDAPVEVREPTQVEISRIKGKLDRLEIGYIRARYPQLADRYVAQARKTLRRATGPGASDPRLLAELGLCECDAGDDRVAEPFLRAAVAGRVIEPRVYFELARIHYNQVLTPNPKAKFTAAQVKEMLELLAAGHRQAPAMAETYVLMAAIWANSAVAPTREQLAGLREGVVLFPGQMSLVYWTAKLHLQYGFGAEANALADFGLALAAEPDKAYFQELKDRSAAGQKAL